MLVTAAVSERVRASSARPPACSRSADREPVRRRPGARGRSGRGRGRRGRGRRRAGARRRAARLSAEAAEGQSRRISQSGRATASQKREEADELAREAAEAKKAAQPGACHVPGWVNSGYTKLRVWGLTEYARVVYLDADALALAPLGELFELPAAVNFAAAPDVFPPDKFNAGVLVLTPDAAVLADMLESVPLLQSHDGGDTGFLNSYFDDWWTRAPAARLAFRCVRADLPHRRLASRGRACDAALLPRVSPPPNPPFRPRASDDFYHLFHRLCRRRFARRR